MVKSTRVHALHASISEMLRATPFRPFDLKMADGDTIHVHHPDFIARAPGSSTVTVYDRDEHFRIVHLSMVVTIEPTRATKGLLGQGGGKR